MAGHISEEPIGPELPVPRAPRESWRQIAHRIELSQRVSNQASPRQGPIQIAISGSW